MERGRVLRRSVFAVLLAVIVGYFFNGAGDIDAGTWHAQSGSPRGETMLPAYAVALIHDWAPQDAAYEGYACSGVEFSPGLILTAAHCLPADATSLGVLGPTNDLCAGGRRRGVTQASVHPSFDRITLAYDVAVLRVARDSRSHTVPVADPANVLPVTVAIGWGPIAPGGARPCTATAGALTPKPDAACAGLSGQGPRFDPRSMLCAGAPGMITGDACPGDSGGPLLAWHPDQGRVEVRGLVSWGAGCGEADRPSAFVDLASVSGWLADATALISQHSGEEVAPPASVPVPSVALH